MYMIAGLCMLKLYQKRHPDINASAYSAYACLAVVIFFSVVGVVSAGAQRGRARLGVATRQPPDRFCLPPQVFGKGNMAFWIVFSVIHIVATLLLSTQLYYMGRWKLGEGLPGGWQGWDGQGAAPGPPALPLGPPALPPLSPQTRASCAGSCTCCTRTASGSAAGPCTW